MTAESERVLDQFKSDLRSLTDNDKYKINALTFCARDYMELAGVPDGIVAATCKHVYSIPSGLKLLGLYVIDSIVKNVATPYRKLYTKFIVELFVHAFQSIRDENGRLKLFNLRTTWKEIFPNSRMFELDSQVRDHDPAWPLLASAESKSTTKVIPRVPKSKRNEAEQKAVAADGASDSPLSATNEAIIAPSRDPRINRKRKSPPKAAVEGQFLIDRDGDRKMESMARKQGLEEEEESKQMPKKTKGLPLFSEKDQDMRSGAPVRPLQSPARTHIWSNYLDKNSEVCARREPQDVDMRFACSTTASCDAPKIKDEPDPVESPTPHSGPLASMRLAPPFPVPNASKSLPAQREGLHHYQQPFRYPPRVSEPQRSSHVPFYRRCELPQPPQPRPVPPIRGPVWSVEIDGFPDMIDIGVDPRMLSLVPTPKPPRRITIDGRQYPLLLDRVQPLIEVDDHFHAVRFRCDHLTVLIDNRPFTIPGTGYTRVYAASKERIAYLGGPGHELVIDGKPHTIPFDSHLTYINVDRQTVSIKLGCEFPQNINVLPAIAPRLLKWAAQGLFGPASSLNLAPLNPLSELARLANGEPPSYEITERSNVVPVAQEQPVLSSTRQLELHPLNSRPHPKDPTPAQDKPKVTTETPSAVAPCLDVHDLFKKLMEAGIVPQATETPPPETLPDIQAYTWEEFRAPFKQEIEGLYVGYQCAQCGVRFENESSPDFAKHLDYHYVKNSAEHQDRRSRSYFQSSHYWLISDMPREGASQFSEQVEEDVREEIKCPAFSDPGMNVCAVCFEKFDLFWDHNEEEWMLRGAVLVGDKVYHPICQEDVGKNFTADQVVDKESENASILAAEPTVEPAPETLSDDQNVPPDVHDDVKSAFPSHVSVKHEQIDNDKDFNFPNRVTSCAPPRTSSLPSLSSLVPHNEEEERLLGFLSPNIKQEDVPLEGFSIPGLSPEPSAQLVSLVKETDLHETTSALANIVSSPVASHPCTQVNSVDDLANTIADIASDPLEALNAVLRGNTSFLSQSLGMR